MLDNLERDTRPSRPVDEVQADLLAARLETHLAQLEAAVFRRITGKKTELQAGVSDVCATQRDEAVAETADG